MDFAKRAIVTGGGTGIGAAVSRLMLAQGYEVVAVGLDEPDWSEHGFSFERLDLLDLDATRAFAERTASEKPVTHFVHNAGFILPNLLESARPEDLVKLTTIHAGAALVFAQALTPGMKERHFGRIIFNSSRASLGARTRTAYSYSKAGIHGMMRTWALELGEFGITVNTVAPGPILTDNFWGIVEKDGPVQQQIANSLPVKRIGLPDDVARAILFFADPLNGYVTGQTLFVCGGASIGSS
jgi:NAD(P)-dependent dehydrogenase (short-subunit alcohol dehydrogenase family)